MEDGQLLDRDHGLARTYSRGAWRLSSLPRLASIVGGSFQLRREDRRRSGAPPSSLTRSHSSIFNSCGACDCTSAPETPSSCPSPMVGYHPSPVALRRDGPADYAAASVISQDSSFGSSKIGPSSSSSFSKYRLNRLYLQHRGPDCQ